jgi:hypothetical protein
VIFREVDLFLLKIIGLILLISAGFSGHVSAQKSSVQLDQKVFGAGPSTKLTELFFDHFSRLPVTKGMTFTVPKRSTKHAGGILASGEYLFGRLGRQLSPKESAQNKAEIILAKIKIGFVAGAGVSVRSLKPLQLEQILKREIKNWQQIGGANSTIVLVGRESTEAVLSELRKTIPLLDRVKYDFILKRDHAVVSLLNGPAGKFAIGFGAFSNFDERNIIKIEGREMGMPLGLVYDLKNRNESIVRAAIDYAISADWQKKVRNAGYGEPGSSR